MATVYQPLGTRQTRFLRFLDDTGLECSIEAIALDEASAYGCLSYAWDDIHGRASRGHQQYQISVDGQLFKIKSNLFAALAHLGAVARSKGLLFWVDAICINQNDLEEKAAQVLLMKELYARANLVLAWVGLPSNIRQTELAVEFMGDVAHVGQEYFLLHKESVINGIVDPKQAVLDILRGHERFRRRSEGDLLESWAGVIELLKRPYWSRAWVHQEVVLSDAKFYVGSWSFTWVELEAIHAFHAVYGGCRELPDRLLLIFSKLTPGPGSRFLDLCRAHVIRHRLLKHRMPARLAPLIRELRLTSCSDARDKVFAALPHAVDADSRVARQILRVDYKMDVWDVFVKAARLSLFLGPGLEILSYVCCSNESRETFNPARRSNEPGLPSWVPDWRISSRIVPLNGMFDRAKKLYDPWPEGMERDMSVDGSKLHVQALVFDQIAVVTSTIGNDEASREAIRIKWPIELQRHPSGFSRGSFNRTLLADSIFADDVTEIRIRGGSVDWQLLNSRLDALGCEQANARRHMLDTLRVVARDRRAGITIAGRLGMFPEEAAAGDLIAALNGGHALYIIRPTGDDRYQFIEECYVDGMMDGQVLGVAAEGGIDAINIVLI